MDSRFRYEVSHVVMNCRDPQESLRTLRALGACREHGEAGETSTCCCVLSQLATGCVTCHTCHGYVTHFRPILGNIVEVTLVTFPILYIVSHAKGTSFP